MGSRSGLTKTNLDQFVLERKSDGARGHAELLLEWSQSGDEEADAWYKVEWRVSESTVEVEEPFGKELLPLVKKVRGKKKESTSFKKLVAELNMLEAQWRAEKAQKAQKKPRAGAAAAAAAPLPPAAKAAEEGGRGMLRAHSSSAIGSQPGLPLPLRLPWTGSAAKEASLAQQQRAASPLQPRARATSPAPPVVDPRAAHRQRVQLHQAARAERGKRREMGQLASPSAQQPLKRSRTRASASGGAGSAHATSAAVIPGTPTVTPPLLAHAGDADVEESYGSQLNGDAGADGASREGSHDAGGASSSRQLCGPAEGAAASPVTAATEPLVLATGGAAVAAAAIVTAAADAQAAAAAAIAVVAADDSAQDGDSCELAFASLFVDAASHVDSPYLDFPSGNGDMPLGLAGLDSLDGDMDLLGFGTDMERAAPAAEAAPGGDGAAPAAEAAPGSDGASPGGDGAAPGGAGGDGVAPAAEAAPGGHGAAPAAEAAPGGDGAAPAAEAAPGGDGAAPAAEAAPGGDGAAPAAEAAPGGDGAAPGGDGAATAAEAAPGGDGAAPVAQVAVEAPSAADVAGAIAAVAVATAALHAREAAGAWASAAASCGTLAAAAAPQAEAQNAEGAGEGGAGRQEAVAQALVAASAAQEAGVAALQAALGHVISPFTGRALPASVCRRPGDRPLAEQLSRHELAAAADPQRAVEAVLDELNSSSMECHLFLVKFRGFELDPGQIAQLDVPHGRPGHWISEGTLARTAPNLLAAWRQGRRPGWATPPPQLHEQRQQQQQQQQRHECGDGAWQAAEARGGGLAPGFVPCLTSSTGGLLLEAPRFHVGTAPADAFVAERAAVPPQPVPSHQAPCAAAGGPAVDVQALQRELQAERQKSAALEEANRQLEETKGLLLQVLAQKEEAWELERARLLQQPAQPAAVLACNGEVGAGQHGGPAHAGPPHTAPPLQPPAEGPPPPSAPRDATPAATPSPVALAGACEAASPVAAGAPPGQRRSNRAPCPKRIYSAEEAPPPSRKRARKGQAATATKLPQVPVEGAAGQPLAGQSWPLEEYVSSLTGRRYPKELCCRPGDVLVCDYVVGMDGDEADSERIMDEWLEVDRAGGTLTWFLVKWKGFELNPSPKAHGGHWEPEFNISVDDHARIDWEREKPPWW